MPATNVNTPGFWDRTMRERWEASGGREQTRLFARHFLHHVRLPRGATSLLDCSCAMGDALPEFRSRYPGLRLEGIDVSPTAIAAADRLFGGIARFRVAAMTDLTDDFDVIYCSNTLEHFEEYREIATTLLRRCRWLYVMVPYRETRDGRPLEVRDGEQHVATFDRSSFRGLRRGGLARRIRTRVIYAPGAWGCGPYAWSTRLRGWMTRDPTLVPSRQIIYEIARSRP